MQGVGTVLFLFFEGKKKEKQYPMWKIAGVCGCKIYYP
jgi:hypothetical protein